jgi:hypothetical protein
MTDRPPSPITSHKPSSDWSKIYLHLFTKITAAKKKMGEIAKKVWNTVKEFFGKVMHQTLCFLGIIKAKPLLTAEQKAKKEKIQEVKKQQRYTPITGHPSIKRNIGEEASKLERIKTINNDPALDDMRHLIKGFAVNCFELIYENKNDEDVSIEDIVESVKEKSGSILEMSRKLIGDSIIPILTEQLINSEKNKDTISTSAVSEILSFLTKDRGSILDDLSGAVDELNNSFTPKSKNKDEVINTESEGQDEKLIERDDQNDIEPEINEAIENLDNKIKEKLSNNLKAIKIQNVSVTDELLDKYSKEIKAWLQDTKKEQTILEYCNSKGLKNQELINQILKHLLMALIELKIGKVEQDFEKYRKLLPSKVRGLILTNTGKISDILSSRFAELIYKDHFSFKTVFKNVLKQTNKHLEAHIEGDKTLQSHLENINKAEEAIKQAPQTDWEKGQQELHKKFLDEEVNPNKILHPNYEGWIYEGGYAKNPGCHQESKRSIELELAESQKSIQEAVCKNLSKEMREILLPDGGLSKLLEELDIFADVSEELKKLSSDLSNLYALFTKSYPQAKILGNIVNELKKPALVFLETKIEEQILVVVQALFDQLTNPSNLDEVLTSAVLPSLKDLLVVNIATTQLVEEVEKNNKEQLTTQFLKILEIKEIGKKIEEIKRKNGKENEKQNELMKQLQEIAGELNVNLQTIDISDQMSSSPYELPREFTSIEKEINALNTKEATSQEKKEGLEKIAKELKVDIDTSDLDGLDSIEKFNSHISNLSNELSIKVRSWTDKKHKIDVAALELLNDLDLKKKDALHAIRNNVVSLTVNACKQFKISKEYTTLKLGQMIEPSIIDLSDYLLELHERQLLNPDTKEIKEMILECFTPVESNEMQNTGGEILYKLLFPIGNFDGMKGKGKLWTSAVNLFVLPNINEQISSLMEKNMGGHEWATSLFINFLKQHPEKEDVRELLFKETVSDENLKKARKILFPKENPTLEEKNEVRKLVIPQLFSEDEICLFEKTEKERKVTKENKNEILKHLFPNKELKNLSDTQKKMIEKMLFPDDVREEERKRQIKKISQLGHDIICKIRDSQVESLNDNGSLLNPLNWMRKPAKAIVRTGIREGIDTAIGKDEKIIEGLINKCYEDLFLRSKQTNLSLVYNIQEVVIEALKKSAKDIDNTKRINNELSKI